MGFPIRSSRSSYGEDPYEEQYPVNNPKREISAAIFNTSYWDLAGLCQTGLKVALKATVAGGVVTTGYFGAAFSPDGSVTPISFVYESVGCYSFAFASQYPDEIGTNRATAFSHGIAMPVDSVTYRGTHTGADDQAVLTDSTQSWVVNELVGSYVYNLTDGSFALITANTADTVTGVLSGGTGNDWDTDDEYLILNPATAGIVNLSSTYQGEVLFFNKDRELVDPAAFTLALW